MDEFLDESVDRLQMLEEIHRDLELRGQQQLTEEQRRNKELILRVEREKQLEIENCTIKYVPGKKNLFDASGWNTPWTSFFFTDPPN